MPQNYTPEFKKKIISDSHVIHSKMYAQKKGVLSRVLPQNMVYPKPVFLNGAQNLTKNAKPKPSPILIFKMKQIL